MTLWQHKIISRYARRFVSRHLDSAALCRARERIEQIVAREWVIQKRLTGRQRMARFLDIGQPDYAPIRKDFQATAQGDGTSVTTEGERRLKLPPLPAAADPQSDRAPQAEPTDSPTPAFTTDLAPEQTIATDEAGWSIENRRFRPKGGCR